MSELRNDRPPNSEIPPRENLQVLITSVQSAFWTNRPSPRSSIGRSKCCWHHSTQNGRLVTLQKAQLHRMTSQTHKLAPTTEDGELDKNPSNSPLKQFSLRGPTGWISKHSNCESKKFVNRRSVSHAVPHYHLQRQNPAGRCSGHCTKHLNCENWACAGPQLLSSISWHTVLKLPVFCPVWKQGLWFAALWKEDGGTRGQSEGRRILIIIQNNRIVFGTDP